MLFLEQIAAELIDGPSTVRYETAVDSASGCLTFRQTSTWNGEVSYSWVFSVPARDLDSRLVEITQPDSAKVRHLQLVCALYRDAIRCTRLQPKQAPHHQRLVRLGLPLSARTADADEIVTSFRGFITGFGAKSPTIYPAPIEGLLAPVKAALTHASGVQVPSNDRKVIYQQSANLEERELLLVRESCRRGFTPDRWTFELLSLDVSAISVCRVPGCSDLWEVTLPSIERLNTTIWQIRLKSETRLWYSSILFPDESSAHRFAAACAECVPQVRERLYHENYEV